MPLDAGHQWTREATVTAGEIAAPATQARRRRIATPSQLVVVETVEQGRLCTHEIQYRGQPPRAPVGEQGRERRQRAPQTIVERMVTLTQTFGIELRTKGPFARTRFDVRHGRGDQMRNCRRKTCRIARENR